MFGWLTRLFSRGGTATPSRKDIIEVQREGKSLERRREELLYKGVELEEQIKALFEDYKKCERDLLKKELLRSLTIKRAEYESIESRLARLGEAATANRRRSAFMESFMDLRQVTEEDLDQLEKLQRVRQEQERRVAIYHDRVIELTETRPETSEAIERLERETLEKLQEQERRTAARQKGTPAEPAAPTESPEEVERQIRELLDKPEAAVAAPERPVAAPEPPAIEKA
jgi:hypothetical protein